MIKVTVDLFSGRPNPTWIINDRTGDDLLKKIAKQPEVISKQGSGYDGLGFRGITIELLGDEKEGKWWRFMEQFIDEKYFYTVQ